MRFEFDGLPEEEIDELLAMMARKEKESDARRAVTGEEPLTVLIGTDRATGRVVIIGPDAEPS